jgi:hypothetical protein
LQGKAKRVELKNENASVFMFFTHARVKFGSVEGPVAM